MSETGCGTMSGYRSGCRCAECRAANTAYYRQRRARMASPTGDSKPCAICGGAIERPGWESAARFAGRSTCSTACKDALIRERVVAARFANDPLSVGTRTVVARTCVTCHRLRDGGRFGPSCRECDACGAKRWRRGKSGDERTEWLHRQSEWFKDKNRRSRERAGRHGQEWTGPELEICGRRELTAAQVAAMLGRTVAAVMAARHRLNTGDPRFVRLQGAVRP